MPARSVRLEYEGGWIWSRKGLLSRPAGHPTSCGVVLRGESDLLPNAWVGFHAFEVFLVARGDHDSEATIGRRAWSPVTGLAFLATVPFLKRGSHTFKPC